VTAVEDGELPDEAYASALAGLPGMGPSRLAALLDAASPRTTWARIRQGVPWQEPAVAATLGSRGEALVADWRRAAAAVEVSQLWEQVQCSRIGVALRGRAGYPPALVDDIEAPVVLFHQGSPDVISGPRVAVVGTRRCSVTGAGVAFELGRDLAEAGVSVVSGLAYGIDGAAHRGALCTKATPPIGVAATGLDVVYPVRQRTLWEAVASSGVLLTEAPLGAQPERWRFPARNRIIAGLADVVVVVESHRRGGSFYTVDEADRRSVDVMAVPGSVRSAAAVGTNDLLAEGRAPARGADDVLLALGLSARIGSDHRELRPPPTAEDQPLLEAVGWQPASLDSLVLRTGWSLPRLATSLDRLCEAGWLHREGGWYQRVAAGNAGTSPVPRSGGSA
jgi:DNA processing protein